VTDPNVRSVRWIAWFDLVVTGAFALPFVAWPLIDIVMQAEGAMFGPTRVHALPQAPWSLFINLMGVLGIVWAIARLVVEDWRLIKIDAAGRIAVAIFIVYGLAVLNLPLLFGAFVISELGGSLIELVAIKQKPLASESPDQ
jgi:hypothetical protein